MATLSLADEQRLIETHLRIAEALAWKWLRAHPAHEKEDILEAAVEALVVAARKYDPDQGKFSTFVYARIEWAIQDAARHLWLSRQVTNLYFDAIHKRSLLAAQLGRHPTTVEWAKRLEISEAELNQIQIKWFQVRNLLEPDDLNQPLHIGDELSFVSDLIPGPDDVEGDALMACEHQLLWAAVDRLPEREQFIIRCRFLEGFTLREIGQFLGLTESRICQLQVRILAKLQIQLQSHLSLAA